MVSSNSYVSLVVTFTTLDESKQFLLYNPNAFQCGLCRIANANNDVSYTKDSIDNTARLCAIAVTTVDHR